MVKALHSARRSRINPKCSGSAMQGVVYLAKALHFEHKLQIFARFLPSLSHKSARPHSGLVPLE